MRQNGSRWQNAHDVAAAPISVVKRSKVASQHDAKAACFVINAVARSMAKTVTREWPFKGRQPVVGRIDGHRDSTGREIQIGDVVEFIDGGQTVVTDFCGPEGFVGDSGAVYWCCVCAVQASAAPLAGKRSAANGAAVQKSFLPDGNHGDNTFEVTK